MAHVSSTQPSDRQRRRTAGRGPGRPRSDQVRRAILDAAVELVTDGGLGALSMSSVAARAGVSRVTLYRWWSSPGSILLDGLLERSHASIEHGADLSARDALAEQMTALIGLFTDDGPTAAAIRAVTAEAESDPQLAKDLREHWHRPRRDAAAAILQRGMITGEISQNLDVEAAIDLLFAPIYHRLLIGHAPLGPELVDQLLSMFDGLTATDPRPRGSAPPSSPTR